MNAGKLPSTRTDFPVAPPTPGAVNRASQASSAFENPEAVSSQAALEAASANDTLAESLNRVTVAEETFGEAANRAGAQEAAAASITAAASDRTTTANERVAAATAAVDIAQSRAAAALATLELAHLKAAQASDNDAEAQLRITRSLAGAEAAVLSTAQAVTVAEAKLVAARKASDDAVNSVSNSAGHGGGFGGNIAIQEAEHSVRAFIDSVNAGQSPVRAFTLELPRLAQAATFAGDGLGAVGKFLSGPWGLALIVGTSLLGPLVGKLLEADTAAQDEADALGKASTASDSFGNAQSLLGKIIDLTTGKLKTQNLTLIETIKLQAQANILAAQAEQKKAVDAVKSHGSSSLGESFLSGLADISGSGAGGGGGTGAGADVAAQQARGLAPLKSTLDQFADVINNPNATTAQLDAALKTTIGNIDTLAARSQLAGRDIIKVKQDVLAAATTRNDQTSNQLVLDAINGKGIDPRLKPYERPKKPKKPKKPKDPFADNQFGIDAATKIAKINDQFNETDALVAKITAGTADLDKLMAELEHRKPPNYQELIASAKEAEVTLRDGLISQVEKSFAEPTTLAQKASKAFQELDAEAANLDATKPPGFEKSLALIQATKAAIQNDIQKPYRDYILDQQRSLEYDQLAAAGRIDEANARKEILALEKQQGPLTQAEKDGVLATVEAIRTEQRELKVRNELNQKYVDALGSIKSAVNDATQAFVRGDLGQFIKTPGKLLDAFQTLQGKAIFDKLFGGAFQGLQDQIDGTAPVKAAGVAMAKAVGDVTASVSQQKFSYDKAKPSLDAATAATDKFTSALNRASGAVDAQGADNANAATNADATNGGSPVDANGDIVVTGKRTPPIDTSVALSIPSGNLPDFTKLEKSLEKSITPEAFFTKAIGDLSTSVAGVFTNPTSAASIGKNIGKFAGEGLQGFSTGAEVSGIAKAVGVHLDKTGSEIGGAIGSFVPIPGGAIIGSILGGIVGDIFGPRAKPGGVSVSSAGGPISTANVGGDAKGIAAGQGLAGNITSGIQQIAQQLGGSLGAFNVSIGTYKGDLRVNENGKALGGVKGSGAYSFGTDQAGAVAKAIQLAVAQGAVHGLDDAVRKAINSSSDVNQALQEALGVKNLELALGGLPASLKQIFDTESASAKDRIRLATTYGLDIVATEKLNDQKRADLVDATLKGRISSLTDFLTSVQSGDLFEGSAADRRTALQTQIKAAQADAEAGKDGAAAVLANLEQQLLTTSKDAFGTAGNEYTDDRSSAVAGVNKVIQMETDRVNAAAGNTQATTDAVTAGNALTSETNDLLAQTNTKLDNLTSALATTGSGPLAINYDLTARSPLLSQKLDAYA